ncbi:MAG TPA: aminopeptidase P family protein, partial [Kiloniellales bacterium]|nr:aminopeptidase P family protein [Kiloniellales bacterium]
DRLAALRAELARRGLDGFVVPHADAHQNEYLPPDAERLAWLTGFTGSAGTAVVLADKAALFVDGRYTLQARDQVGEGLYEIRHLVREPPGRWLEGVLRKGARVGYDPWLHSEAQRGRLAKSVEKAEAELVAVEDNPIDTLWIDRPAPPAAPIVPHPLEYAGQGSAEKRMEIAGKLAEEAAEAVALSAPDSIAWLLNVRGGDVAHTPLPLSFAILQADGTLDWFVEPAKVGPELETHLGNGVRRHPPADFGPALAELGREKRRVLVDPEGTAAWIFDRLREAGAEPVAGPDPCLLPKACKNAAELDGTRRAHERDGRALVRFLAWLEREIEARAGGPGPSELELADRLRAFRAEHPLFRDLSFATISGSGPNGAIVHYRVTPESNRRLMPGELYLVDSGAQYPDGTTDVTRTVAIGTPSAEMRDRFTRVLKGHIAIARARFPKGTTGSQLDAIARYALWQAGLDYDHGTGHGVGSYLGVHEGPQRISTVPNRIPLEPGMIVSNEPGYYKTGGYGIRIENLVAVTDLNDAGEDGREMRGFETLTLAPIDLRLVEPALLTPEEIDWLDAYHARVRAAHRESLDPAEAAWLDRATRPLAG